MEEAWLDPDFLETLTNYKVDREKQKPPLKKPGIQKAPMGCGTLLKVRL